MIKSALIVFIFFSALGAYAGSGQIKIKLKSVTDVEATYSSANINMVRTDYGFSLIEQRVDVLQLEVDPSAAKKMMRSKKMLNAEKYPEIVVSNVVCISTAAETGSCKGDLQVKGVKKPIRHSVFKVENNILYLKFDFLLSDYNIARKALLFKIDDLALVEAAIRLN